MVLVLFQFHLIQILFDESFSFLFFSSLYRMKTMIHCISAELRMVMRPNVETIHQDKSGSENEEQRPKRTEEKPNTNAVDTYTSRKWSGKKGARVRLLVRSQKETMKKFHTVPGNEELRPNKTSKRNKKRKWPNERQSKRKHTLKILKRCYHRQTMRCWRIQ